MHKTNLIRSSLLLSGLFIPVLILGLHSVAGVDNNCFTRRVRLCVDICKVYPHDPGAFTQGLVFDSGKLYESTGRYGRSTLRRIDIVTGKVLKKIFLPRDLFAEGITVIGHRIYQLTWKARKGFVYDKKTLLPFKEFRYSTEGWGLAHDGSHLIMSDGSDRLFFLSIDDLRVEKIIYVHESNGNNIKYLNELELVNGKIFANIWQSDRIAIVSPDTGLVELYIDLSTIWNWVKKNSNDLPVGVPNGIAYDPGKKSLFITGKLWPYLFECNIDKLLY